MADGILARTGELVVGLFNKLTFYAAPCLSCGAFAFLVRKPLGLDAASAFISGAFVAVGPVYFSYASNWGMRRGLAEWKRWHEEGMISDEDYERLRREALRWFGRKRF